MEADQYGWLADHPENLWSPEETTDCPRCGRVAGLKARKWCGPDNPDMRGLEFMAAVRCLNLKCGFANGDYWGKPKTPDLTHLDITEPEAPPEIPDCLPDWL